MEKTKSCCYDSTHNREKLMNISEIEFRKHFQRAFLDETKTIRCCDNTVVLMLSSQEAEVSPEHNIDHKLAQM